MFRLDVNWNSEAPIRYAPGLADGDPANGGVSQPGARPFARLTDREFQILELVATGLTNSEIARRLVVNPKTVRNHVSNVFAKLNASDRASAIVLAHRHGIGI